MTDYRRLYIPGASWFFTVNLAQRHGNRLLVEYIDCLQASFAYVKRRHPFRIDAIAVMPEHLHCIWTLPDDDTDFSTRWNLIKGHFSRRMPKDDVVSPSRVRKRERGIWQRRLWEHCLRDQDDFNRHVDYIHWNSVKHGWVQRVQDWPHSSFHHYVRQGIYPLDWLGDGVDDMVGGE